jgi:hypothetical protein
MKDIAAPAWRPTDRSVAQVARLGPARVSVLLLAWLWVSACAAPTVPADTGVDEDAHALVSTEEPTDPAAPATPANLISAEDLASYQPYFPGVARGERVELVRRDLSQADIDSGNLHFVKLYDEPGDLLGFGRDIFTPVGCAAGVCTAIRFTVVFDWDSSAFDVFHVAGTDLDFKKYWQDEYLSFDEGDRARLGELVRAPPEILLAAPSEGDLVEDTYGSAPTRPEYQSHVVRGAAFTCYLVARFAVESEALIGSFVATEMGAR